MNVIYILSEEGEKQAYEAEHVQDLLAKRVLSPHTPFWMEGMVEWRPLWELSTSAGKTIAPPRRTESPEEESASSAKLLQAGIEPAVVPVVATPNVPEAPVQTPSRKGSRRFFFRANPIPLTVGLKILMMGSIGALGWFIYQCLDKINGWSNSTTDDPMTALLRLAQPVAITQAELTAFYEFFGVLVGLHVLVEIGFYYWVYFANKNSRIFATNIKFTPGWSVGCFFIPFINFYQPYQVMQEIWKVSENPKAWNGRSDSVFVGFWFVSRLSIIFFIRYLFPTNSSLSDNPAVEMMGTVEMLATMAGILMVIETTTLILVSVVTWRQVAWVRK